MNSKHPELMCQMVHTESTGPPSAYRPIDVSYYVLAVHILADIMHYLGLFGLSALLRIACLYCYPCKT